jgi:hypothetical protein
MKTKKSYSIRTAHRAGEDYSTMVIACAGTGEHIAEYRLTPGKERPEINQTRRAIDRHLEKPGATLRNYQW